MLVNYCLPFDCLVLWY